MIFFVTSHPIMKRLLLLAHIVCLCLAVAAQKHVVADGNIRSLQVTVNGEAGLLPVIRLGSDDVLEFSFDDLTHEYYRYT